MSTKVFVGNLNYRTTDEQLRRFFGDLGEVASVIVPKDRETGRPRGFAFVEFVSEELAQLAVRVYDGRTLGGRALKVKPAEARAAPRKTERRRPDPLRALSDEADELPDFDIGYGARGRARDRDWRRLRASKRSL